MILTPTPHFMRSLAAMIGFMIAFGLGLRAVASDAQCAKTQPEMRKMFPIEMRILKDFEGTWSDQNYRQGIDKRARTFVINASAKQIQIQSETKNSEGVVTTGQPQTAIMCKTEDGPVLKAGDLEIPMLILSHKEARFKLGNSWHPFFRINEIHVNFFPPTQGAGSAAAAGSSGGASPSGKAVTTPAAINPGRQ